MIGYNRLGSNGFLGNQMFQYAGLRGIAANMNYKWVIPSPDSYYDANYGLFDCFKMGSVSSDNFGLINSKSHATGLCHFDDELFNNCPDNISLNDYFQSEKYFKNVEHIIRKDFTFKDGILETCKPFIESLHKPVFLHVRRGDYLNVPDFHPVCSIDYYRKALSYFDDDCEVFPSEIAFHSLFCVVIGINGKKILDSRELHQQFKEARPVHLCTPRTRATPAPGQRHLLAS